MYVRTYKIYTTFETFSGGTEKDFILPTVCIDLHMPTFMCTTTTITLLCSVILNRSYMDVLLSVIIVISTTVVSPEPFP